MANTRKEDSITLPAPALNTPRGSSVVDAARVTFEWERVEGATRYQLEVARDPEFEDLAVEEVLEDAVSVTLEDVFPADGTTFYWRVLAGNEEGWSNGDHVESFVSATAEEAKALVATPDEDYGPYPTLIRSASVEAAAEVTGGEELYEEEVRMGVAHEGVEAGQIIGIAIAIMAAIVMMVIVLFQWTQVVEMETRASATGRSGYPELRQLRMQAQQQLGEYAVLDEEQGIYRIPIERAMDLMVQEAANDAGTSATSGTETPAQTGAETDGGPDVETEAGAEVEAQGAAGAPQP